MRTGEKRQEPRTPCNKPGQYLRMANAESFEEGQTTVLDISSAGMLLHMPQPYSPGSIIELTLPDAINHQFTTVLEARWTKPHHEDNRYLVGCQTLFASFS